MLRLSLPGIDIGADAWPAQPGSEGHVLVWCYPHHAEDITTLLILPGAPALPMPGEREI